MPKNIALVNFLSKVILHLSDIETFKSHLDPQCLLIAGLIFTITLSDNCF